MGDNEDPLKDIWEAMYEKCQRAKIPQEEIDKCTETIELLRLLRAKRAEQKRRQELRKMDKRFKNRDRDQHGQGKK